MKKLKKRGFVICTVRGASNEYKKELEDFVSKKEAEGWIMHLPHRDTKQDAKGIDICTQNFNAIFDADTVFVFYNDKSQGTHFDMGMTFAISQIIKMGDLIGGAPLNIEVVKNVEYGEGKSYGRMLNEWENEQ